MLPRLLALLLVALLGLGLPRAATAQDAQTAAAIETVIDSQLDAFNARDVGAAFGFASPMIQRLFGTPGNFGLMVETGYPMVWTNSGARFLDLREIDGRLWQEVLVTDAAGAQHLLDYTMIQTEAGWKIDGVVLVPQPDVGV